MGSKLSQKHVLRVAGRHKWWQKALFLGHDEYKRTKARRRFIIYRQCRRGLAKEHCWPRPDSDTGDIKTDNNRNGVIPTLARQHHEQEPCAHPLSKTRWPDKKNL